MKNVGMGNRYHVMIGDPDAFYRTAGYKAPHDVTVTLRQLDFEEIKVFCRWKAKAISLPVMLLQLIKVGLSLRKKDTILTQYPSYPFLFIAMLFFLRCDNRIVLIHDFHSLRLRGKLSLLEKLNMKFFNKFIVHTEEMKAYLSRFYPNKDYYVLGYFGYILDDPHQDDGQYTTTNEVCFAGNIDKSIFIEQLVKNNGLGCKFHLYGICKKALSKSASNVIYEGVFHPDEVGKLKGSWGLVWDGDSISTCDGFLGEYLKIIAPHKFSLYIAVGLPVIVWSGSAMAKVVREKKIGIVVDSLYELKDKIEAISYDKYLLVKMNVRDFGFDLRNNEMLKSVISNIMTENLMK